MLHRIKIRTAACHKRLFTRKDPLVPCNQHTQYLRLRRLVLRHQVQPLAASAPYETDHVDCFCRFGPYQRRPHVLQRLRTSLVRALCVDRDVLVNRRGPISSLVDPASLKEHFDRVFDTANLPDEHVSCHRHDNDDPLSVLEQNEEHPCLLDLLLQHRAGTDNQCVLYPALQGIQ